MYIYIHIHKSMYVCFFGGPPVYIYIYLWVCHVYMHMYAQGLFSLGI